MPIKTFGSRRQQKPEEYQTIVENLEDKLEDDSDFITVERICDNILVKYDQINKQSRPKIPIEDENYLNVKPQYKGTCVTGRKYGHKSKDCSYREGANVPKFNYCDKPGHANRDFWKQEIVEILPGKNVAIDTAIRDVK